MGFNSGFKGLSRVLNMTHSGRSSKSNDTGIRTTFEAESHYRYELRIDMQGHGWNMFILCLVIQYCGDTRCFFGCVIAEAIYVI